MSTTSKRQPDRQRDRPRGNAARQVHEHAAQNGVVSLVLGGKRLNAESVLEFRHGNAAVHEPAAVLALHGPGILVRGVDLSGQGRENVAGRDDALQRAVFIDNEYNVQTLFLKAFQQLQTGERFGTNTGGRHWAVSSREKVSASFADSAHSSSA